MFGIMVHFSSLHGFVQGFQLRPSMVEFGLSGEPCASGLVTNQEVICTMVTT